ncbi:hypothetical protein GCM10010915_13730 [Microbacterium faecale]|uniref:Uncharacterized protein n=1 Tax=Microbacterium faecale TaxID=1804630 RepID=A0A916Y8U7_9MICO|nr:hypothetical protein [Microbacterium faecale]GGD34589.1 hypothetical protein GCM10010915_13730 [Microbacterium faecale]
MKRTIVARGIATAAAAGLLTVTLTGCFANPLEMITGGSDDGAIPSGADELIEGITGGGVDIEFGSMPDNFPAEVPVVSDDVLQSTSINSDDGSGMMVVVSDPRGFDELVQQVRGDFSGWDEVMWTEMGELVNGTFTLDESLTVQVGVAEASEGEDTTVSYMVFLGE